LNKIITISILAVIFLSISITSISAQSKYDIPSWVKGVAGFWAEGKITDADFGEAISFLIEQKIIKVAIPVQDNTELQNKISQLESKNIALQNENSNLKNENSKLKLEAQKISKEPTPTPVQNSGFSDLICKGEYGIVKMSGRYTNDAQPTQGVMLKLILLDSNKKIVATGIGSITQMNAYETKYFDAVAFYEGAFTSCEVQIEFK
jgi:hypothetical protein